MTLTAFQVAEGSPDDYSYIGVQTIWVMSGQTNAVRGPRHRQKRRDSEAS